VHDRRAQLSRDSQPEVSDAGRGNKVTRLVIGATSGDDCTKQFFTNLIVTSSSSCLVTKCFPCLNFNFWNNLGRSLREGKNVRTMNWKKALRILRKFGATKDLNGTRSCLKTRLRWNENSFSRFFSRFRKP